ncbi:DUF2141 domain-containing protein [Corallococcus aberystwythensis]|uniref:DUF2141 domain-containing protein n=1 Tax=Corallococcus aberystwythensis TaxID=2316722 RepID=A0A3A8QHT7_9BACT|nr:DUF2141 domain-containing protein [Corallococcus aberystwythensis]RKH64452.1 DUF2141 domain-containing protein [Corallococcus aberystwythensis]
MKTLLAASLLLLAANAHAATLTLDIQGLTKKTGHVLIAVHADAASFNDKGKPMAVRTVEVKDAKVTVTIPDLAPGTYAVSLFHDANDNNKLDTNFIGIPKEGYGFSNNVGARGKPSFDEAKFTLAADGTVLTLTVF